MSKRLNNLYEQFQTIPCIQSHYQIEGHEFQLTRIDDYTFHFNSTAQAPELKLNLPEEMIHHIQSYLIVQDKVEIKYPRDYPFKCPKFSLLSGKHESELCVLNYSYDRDWTPAFTFEKDILCLIQYII